jgi:FtsP/CotA-like multicopper oxidase with cupredoxin domain
MKRLTYFMVAGVAVFAMAMQGGISPANANQGPAGATWYANSPSSLVNKKNPLDAAHDTGIALRKFVDSLPGVGPTHANNLGQYIPLATADTATYPGSDYYHLGIVEYTKKVHTDLASDDPTYTGTRFRGYVDLSAVPSGQTPQDVAQYAGPLILAQRDRPVRLLVENRLPTSSDASGGKLFIPVDKLMMGAGPGPDGVTDYTQNRAVVHLHGGVTPWISDGTPHQWFTPVGENATYAKGASFQNVPDMVGAGKSIPVPSDTDGLATYFYTNAQSSRLMFYHEHALGITRLGVYVGLAAPYVIWDSIEEDLIMGTNVGTLPAGNPNAGALANVNPGLLKILPDQLGDPYHKYGIPLIIQDKTFVPKNIAVQDDKWVDPAWGKYGDLWFPHVYEPNQAPLTASNESGASEYGRWDYGPWFWPVFPALPMDGHVNPQDYDRSAVPEGFMDTMMVNGTVYPYLVVAPTAYRFRILNACNDRYLNLQLYRAAGTEVTMMPATYQKNFVRKFPNLNLPVDGRAGGIPNPNTGGPNFIQIGSEGGFLPAPVVIQNQPVNYDYNRRSIVVLNVTDKALYLGPAERADVIIDFTKYRGKTIVLYNDAPAPMPGFDPRNDYYTGNPDMTSSGGAPSTAKKYGPNTRTIMVFKVTGRLPKGVKAKVFDLAALQQVWPAVYVADQAPPIVPQTAYPGPWKADSNTYSSIQATDLTFKPVLPDWSGIDPASVTESMTGNDHMKTIQELFDQYGRMNATLGIEIPNNPSALVQTTVPLGYPDPPTENLKAGTTYLWKITHNGVDTHAVHVHLFNVQVINRVGWDGAVTPPDANELGWKETVRMNPLEDIVVALKPEIPPYPAGWGVLPNSTRLLDPTKPLNATWQSFDPSTGATVTVTNVLTDYQNEYVWHCHLLGHEENDMMRPIAVTP